MTDSERLDAILQELRLLRKAAQTKSGKPHLITIRTLHSQQGWDRTKATDVIIDANKVTKIQPFEFWTGVGSETFSGAFIHLGKDDGYHVAHTPAEVQAIIDA